MALHSVYDAVTFKAHTGTTMGTHKWVETKIFRDIDTPLKRLKDDNYQIVAADISESTKDYRDIDYSVPTALLLGAEKYGISDAAYPYIDQCITVPMMGMVESFNVSVACAIILAEARRQREVAGLYTQRRITDDCFAKTILEWTQPLVAKYCQKHGITYPELDDKGDIIDNRWRRT
jgi:tRNA (guanosine-2'-O-)-methyltransferase